MHCFDVLCLCASSPFLLSRLMVTESYDYQEVEKTMMYYSTPLVKESDFPFNFYLLDLPQNNTGQWVKHLVDLWMANMPNGQWANWVVRHFFSSFARIQQPFHFLCLNWNQDQNSLKMKYGVCVVQLSLLRLQLVYCGYAPELFRPCHVNCKLQTTNRKENKILYVFTLYFHRT